MILESDSETCARCPRRIVQIITLAGGYNAALCAQCGNDWRTVVDNDPLFEEYEQASERYSVSMRQAAFVGGYEANKQQIAEARIALKDAQSKLYVKAQRWVLRCVETKK